MNVLFLVFYCVVQFPSALGLNCLKCYKSDYRKCDASQKMEKCPDKSTKCYSLRYYDELDNGEEEHGFKKGCVDSKIQKCNDLCNRFEDMGYKACKPHCCEGEMCNENGFKDLADKSKKKKRSSMDPNFSGNSDSFIQSCNKLTFFTLCVISFLLYIFFT